jgi:hypothetical protein
VNLTLTQNIMQLIWLPLNVVSGIFLVIFVYLFIILSYMWFVGQIKILTDIIKKIYRVIEEFDVDKRKDICTLSITLFILTLSTIANYYLSLDDFNNSKTELLFQNFGHSMSKAVAVYYIFGTVCLIVCYIYTLLDPKNSENISYSDDTKFKLKRSSLLVNFGLVFNLILNPISIFLITTQSLSLYYILSNLDSLHMLDTPLIKLPIFYAFAIITQYPMSIISAFIIFINFLTVFCAAFGSMSLIFIKFKHLRN